MRSLLVAAALLLLAPAAAHADAISLSQQPLRERSEWRALVLDPPPLAYPRAVRVDGEGVEHPDGLSGEGGEATPITALGGAAPTLTLDLGVNTGGTIEVGIKDGTGAPVHLAYAEAARYLSPFGDNVEGSLGTNDVPDGRWDVFPGAPGTWRSPAVRGGQRWVTLTLDAPGTVAIDYVRVRVGHLRSTAEDYTGHFLSSDDVVNRAWYASAYTAAAATEASSMIMMDGAKRDRMAFVGDLTVGALTGIDAFRAGPQVARNTIRVFSCQQATNGFLPGNSDTTTQCPDTPPEPSKPDTGVLRSGEYIAWYIVAAEDYLMRTGDADYVRGLLPVLRRAAGYLRDNIEDGWYAGGSQPGLEYGWMAAGGNGPGTYTNMVVFRAFRTLAALERRLGGGEAAAKPWDEQAAAMRTQLLTAFDPQAGAFRGNRDPEVTTHPQDANVEAVITGLLSGDAADRALRVVRDKLWTTFGPRHSEADNAYISPYMTSYELEARLRRRDTAGALELIRRLWGHMLRSDPGSTTWEKVALDGSPQPNFGNPGGAAPTSRPEGEGYVSLAHAWSTGPVPALSEWVVGLRAVEPGHRRWLVDPQPGDLRWAQARVLTRHGALAARFARGEGDRAWRLTVSAPRGTRGAVVVPTLGGGREIARDGRVVWRDGAPVGGVRASAAPGGVRFEDVRGTSTFAWAD